MWFERRIYPTILKTFSVKERTVWLKTEDLNWSIVITDCIDYRILYNDMWFWETLINTFRQALPVVFRLMDTIDVYSYQHFWMLTLLVFCMVSKIKFVAVRTVNSELDWLIKQEVRGSIVKICHPKYLSILLFIKGLSTWTLFFRTKQKWKLDIIQIVIVLSENFGVYKWSMISGNGVNISSASIYFSSLYGILSHLMLCFKYIFLENFIYSSSNVYSVLSFNSERCPFI